jgi:hypothetical protein
VLIAVDGVALGLGAQGSPPHGDDRHERKDAEGDAGDHERCGVRTACTAPI